MNERLSGLVRIGLACLCTTFALQAANAAGSAPFVDLESYVQFVQKQHKAPFDRDGSLLPPGGAQALLKKQVAAREARAAAPALTTSFRNVQVTQDRNPWPKAEVAAAIDPGAPGN